MEFIFFFLAIGCALFAYWLEQRRWTTVVRTTDHERFQQWLQCLERENVAYRKISYTCVTGDALYTVYMIKVLSNQADSVELLFRNQ